MRALAKINLGLDVLGKREDGYHEVRMVMQTVNLFDTLEISRTSGAGVTMETNRHFLPVDDNNLCVRAAKLMQEEFDLSGGLHIRLLQADSGGGRYGRRKFRRRGGALWTEPHVRPGTDQTGTDAQRCFAGGGCALLCHAGARRWRRGIGEKLRPLPAMVKCPVLVAKPPISVSTKTVYERLDSLEQPPTRIWMGCWRHCRRGI